MIRFSCPACGAVLTTEAHRAGRKTACPKCGQRLEVPRPAANKATLGVPLPAPPHPVPASAPIITESEPMRRVKRRRRRFVMPMIAGVVVVALLIACVFLTTTRPWTAFGPPSGTPSGGGSPLTPMHEGDPLTAEEEAVKAFILDNAGNPQSFEPMRWGPNVTGEAYVAMLKEADAPVQKKKAAEKAKQDAEEKAAKAAGKPYFRLPPQAPFHDALKPSAEDLLKAGADKVAVIVRVRYRIKRWEIEGVVVQDNLYEVRKDGSVAPAPAGGVLDEGGDTWFEDLKTRLKPPQFP